MTAFEGQYLIASDDLAIYIQNKDEKTAKELFETAAHDLFETWFLKGSLLKELLFKGLIQKESTTIESSEKPVLTMPNLDLGHYSNMELAI